MRKNVPQAEEPVASDRWPLRLARSVLSVFDCRERGGAEWYCRSTPPKEKYVVSEEPISLGSLAYACNVYDAMTDFGSSLGEFRLRVNGNPDLDEQDHRQALLTWLNAWGCRIALNSHVLLSNELAAWHKVAIGRLPDPTDRLVTMDGPTLDKFEKLFDQLSGLRAQDGGRRFGPTAASKTLFALRPHVFAPWDEAIRHGFAADGSGASYVRFLQIIRNDLRQVAQQCLHQGIHPEDLPGRLGRPESTAPQLIGEYYWITATKRVKPPDPETVREWLTWS